MIKSKNTLVAESAMLTGVVSEMRSIQVKEKMRMIGGLLHICLTNIAIGIR
jgi:hypothetical protein